MTNVVFYGDYSVGKSTLVNRIINDKYEIVQPTIGAVYNRIEKDNKIMEIWDTAGSERFNSVMPIYLRKADIIILCIDILDTLNSINKKIKFIKEVVDENVKVFIVITKLDKCFIPYSMRNREYYYLSSKTGEGIDELLNDILKELPNKPKRDNTISLSYKEDKKRWCCLI